MADFVSSLLLAYAALGLLFSIGFVLRGAQQLDAPAGRSGWGFRLMIVPGTAALWPFLWWRWWRSAR